ncbi:DUF4097 family beta strand repeat-containing protein [Fodinibius salsisoli]|uniref:DUF4097 family beta strand repeat protein n=1 Tax=Fodinibius salsisoli TaxID=2820877 RepID=A0ABT3PSB5_9BACT|nr:DUF4097 family beta strand repeat-containing protein [Fodinibius salsisoli]MCW9708762.1 DUF4097 family beta strand repeat protein [Fodinibius salsisoli]
MKYVKTGFFTALLITLAGTVWAQDEAFKLNETYPIAEEGTLHLVSDDAEVTIEGADRSDVHVVIYRHVDMDGWKVEKSGTFDVEVKQRDGDLYITEKSDEERRVVVGSVKEEYQITIQAPHDIALDIQGDDDRYTIRNINRGIRLEADDTEAEILNAGGQQFNFSMDDGRINMDRGQGSLELSMDDGTFSVAQGTFDNWNTQMDDGIITLGTRLVDGGSYSLDMDDGSLKLNIAGGGGRFIINHDDPEIDFGGSFEAVRAGENHSEYRLAGGNAEVEINTDDGEITLSVI